MTGKSELSLPSATAAPGEAPDPEDRLGRQDAFNALFQSHYEDLRRGLTVSVRRLYFAWRKPLDQATLDDEIQYIFLRVLGTGGVFDPTVKGFKSWVYMVAMRALADRNRAFVVSTKRPRVIREGDLLGRALWGEVPAEAPVGSFTLDDDDRIARVRREIDRLEQRSRRALALRYIEGRDYPAVARALGVSEAAARGLVSRGLKRIKDRLSDTYDRAS